MADRTFWEHRVNRDDQAPKPVPVDNAFAFVLHALLVVSFRGVCAFKFEHARHASHPYAFLVARAVNFQPFPNQVCSLTYLGAF